MQKQRGTLGIEWREKVFAYFLIYLFFMFSDLNVLDYQVNVKIRQRYH